MNESDPQTIQEAKASPFWDKWKEVIQVELYSLLKLRVFGKIQEAPLVIHLLAIVGFLCRSIMIKYKLFVSQGFTQRFGIDGYGCNEFSLVDSFYYSTKS